MPLPAALPLILAGVGTAGNALQSYLQSRKAGQRMGRLEQRGMEAFMGLQEPSWLEQLLQSQFNTGQDGQMQMLRRLPGFGALQELSGTGGATDITSFLESLAPIRNRQLSQGLGSLWAGAPGLGQRFGSSMQQQSAGLTERHLQNIASQDAATALQLHEAAQGRRLGASQALGGLSSGLLQLLQQAAVSRQGLGLQALGITAGMPQVQAPGLGQPAIDFGQLLLISQLFGGGAPTSTAAPNPWRPRF